MNCEVSVYRKKGFRKFTKSKTAKTTVDLFKKWLAEQGLADEKIVAIEIELENGMKYICNSKGWHRIN